MTIIQAVLCGLLYYLSISWFGLVVWGFMKPLVLGLLVGLVLGDVSTGAIVGATINLLYVAHVTAGGSVPADTGLAGVVGTTLAITGGLNASAAIAIAVPIGILGSIIHYARMAWNSAFVGIAEKMIENGKYEKIWIANVLLPQILLMTTSCILVALCCYFGSEYISGIIKVLGGTVLGIMTAVGEMLPSVGIGLTLVYIFKGEAKIFLFVGFVLAAIFGLSLVQIGFLGAIMAVAYIQLDKHEDNLDKGGLF